MRTAVIGLGSRAEMWVRGLAQRHALVAFCDSNAHRMAAHNRWLGRTGHEPVPTYEPARFDEMLTNQGVDTVVVCTPDVFHRPYVEGALALDRNVLVEKPLATTFDDLRRIVSADRSSKGSVRIGFNYRYNPAHAEVRRLLAAGVIGEVGSVQFEWCLDTHHGADYFRRWHRSEAFSGGLLVHKSSHHFDLVSWWLGGADPVRVTAEGRLFCYGPEGRRKGDDRFSMDLASSARLRELYADAGDGYRRDGDVFSSEINIRDDMAVLLRWSTGATMTYHLHAYSPWEGYRVAFNGSEGRLELHVVEHEWSKPGSRQLAARLSGAPEGEPMRWRIRVRPLWDEPFDVAVPPESGAHGGGDDRMLSDLLDGVKDDPLGRMAGLPDGVRAAVTGLSANESMATQQPADAAAHLRQVFGSDRTGGEPVYPTSPPGNDPPGSTE